MLWQPSRVIRLTLCDELSSSSLPHQAGAKPLQRRGQVKYRWCEFAEEDEEAVRHNSIFQDSSFVWFNFISC
jgi:hypothetical protein